MGSTHSYTYPVRVLGIFSNVLQNNGNCVQQFGTLIRFNVHNKILNILLKLLDISVVSDCKCRGDIPILRTHFVTILSL